MTRFDELDELDDNVAALGESLNRTSGLVSEFSDSVTQVGRAFSTTGKDGKSLADGLSGNLRTALDDVLINGSKFSDVLRDVSRQMLDNAFKSAITPVTEGLSSTVGSGVQSLVSGILPFAQGGAFTQGRVTPFAKGGVVGGPVNFPMRGGMGLMGEAGPEAIMPLTRSADGSLGVRNAGGGQPVTMNFNIQTPDVEGFRRSQGQIAARMGRLLNQGQRLG